MDCKVSDWNAWGKCSLSCGLGGTKTRSRKVIREAEHGGAACPALEDTMVCKFVKLCPGAYLAHICSFLNIRLAKTWISTDKPLNFQLTAKLAIGAHGANAV